MYTAACLWSIFCNATQGRRRSSIGDMSAVLDVASRKEKQNTVYASPYNSVTLRFASTVSRKPWREIWSTPLHCSRLYNCNKLSRGECSFNVHSRSAAGAAMTSCTRQHDCDKKPTLWQRNSITHEDQIAPTKVRAPLDSRIKLVLRHESLS